MFDHLNDTLTACDLMTRDAEAVRDDLPLRDAAAWLTRRERRAAPVVDASGQCVGVLSATDLVRWVAGLADATPRSPTCGYQEKYRAPGGRETVLCRLADGACPLQQRRELAGRTALACAEPYSVPSDWQVVQPEERPGAVVRDVMTTDPVTAGPATPAAELARLMLDRGVHRLVVLDDDRRPVGVVSASDLLQVMAHPELATPAEAR